MHRTIARIALALFVCFGLLTSEVAAYQLENFEWGDPRNSVIAKIKKKSWQRAPSNSDMTVEATAVLFQQPCSVKFFFTPSLTLASIQVRWETDAIGEEVWRSLKEDYGLPNVVNPGIRHYEWLGSFKNQKVTLDYPNTDIAEETTLVYTSGRT